MKGNRTVFRTDGFTLIELLGVMTIIAIVMTMTIVSFQGVGQGAKLDTAVRNMRTTMSLARQWAITKNVTTYVVFPDQGDRAFRAYAVFDENGQVSEWNMLPMGMIIDDSNSTSPLQNEHKIFATQEGDEDMHYIAFKPTGDTTGSATAYRGIHVMEGVVEGSVIVARNTNRVMEIYTYPATGLAKIREL